MLTKSKSMIFSWKIDVFCTVNHCKRSKTRKDSSCWNLVIWMKIIFWPESVTKSHFWVKKWFPSRWPNFNTNQICEFLTYSNDSRCKRHLLFMEISLGNIWLTFRQHLLPKCCLNHHYKNPFCDFFVVITFLRQHLGNKCSLNVDQISNFNFFIHRRYILLQKVLAYVYNSYRIRLWEKLWENVVFTEIPEI